MTALLSRRGKHLKRSHKFPSGAFAVFDVTMASYPAGEAMAELAYASCMERFEPFVGNQYEASTLEIMTLYPTTESWRQNDREVVCAVYDINEDKLVGSAKGLAL